MAADDPRGAVAAPERSLRTSAAPSGADTLDRHSMPYVPALDGLRGLAVAAVLFFHGGFSWATGGFLGVSTFFTLSGFLITTLLLAEHERHDQIRLRGFWTRRFRRLTPASLLCLDGVVVFGALVATSAQLETLRVEVLAALAQVANWQLIAAGTSYADIFTAPSPVQHFWSLAIEAQFYLLFPLTMVGLVALGRRTGNPLRGVAVGLSVALAGSLLATFLLQGAATDRIYYGTDTRAAELTIGALLAVALHGRRLSRTVGSALAWLGLVALGMTLLLWSVVQLDDGWLYRGGLAAFAVVSAAIIAGALQEQGPLRAALSWEPLRRLGLISYGVYLFHWPIFLWLTPERTGLGQWPLFGLRVAATLAAAATSFLLLERPFQARQIFTGREPLVLAPLAVAVIVASTLVITRPDPNAEPTFEEAQALLESGNFGDAPLDDTATTAPPDLAAAGQPEIAIYGDSTGLRLALGFGRWVHTTALARGQGGHTELGCGLMPAAYFTHFRYDGEADSRDVCPQVDQAWTDDIAATDPDIAVVMVGPWEVVDWWDEARGEWRHVGQPDFDDLLLGRIHDAVDILSAGGAKVYWLSSPQIQVGMQDGRPPAFERPASDPLRMQRFNSLVAQVAAERPDDVEIIDLAGYLRTTPGGELDPVLRPDGIHFTWYAATQVSSDWLGPEILRRYMADAASTSTTTPAPPPAPAPSVPGTG